MDYASALGCPRIHILAGLRHLGANRETYLANLRWAAGQACSRGLGITIEPINQRDIPAYYLHTTDLARSIIEEVGQPNLGLQLDLYHRQIEEGDCTAAIREFAPLVHHYQVAGPPDRGEPDDGELNYDYLFGQIDASGYRGWVGCEYKPRHGTLAGLGWLNRITSQLGSSRTRHLRQ